MKTSFPNGNLNEKLPDRWHNLGLNEKLLDKLPLPIVKTDRNVLPVVLSYHPQNPVLSSIETHLPQNLFGHKGILPEPKTSLLFLNPFHLILLFCITSIESPQLGYYPGKFVEILFGLPENPLKGLCRRRPIPDRIDNPHHILKTETIHFFSLQMFNFIP